MIKVLYKKPGTEPETKLIDPTAEKIRFLVGGHFEASHTYIGRQLFAFYCNEAGKLNGLAPNFMNVVDGRAYDVVVGSVVFFRVDGENEASLSDFDVDVLKAWLNLYSL